MDLQEARQQVGRQQRSGVDDRDYFPLGGGLNTENAPLQLKPGELIGCLNYEPQTLGGYERFHGYERLDGQTAPSLAPYWILNFTGGIPANYPIIGNIVNGQTSGATAKVLLANVLGTPNTTGYLILWTLSGNFIDGENLRVAAVVFAVANGTATANTASTDALNTAYNLAVREAQRALILVVPGSGPVLGVVEYRGNVYAFRNNAGGTAAVMFKATATGWVAVPGYPVLNFSLGTSLIKAGDTVIGGTSGNSAVVARVVLSSGSWDAGTAAGYLILNAGAPAFVNGEILNDAAVASGTTVGTAVAPVLLPNGIYDFRVHNFYGNSGTIRLYGVDQTNPGFEYQDNFSGNLPFFCQIRSGMPIDAPTKLAVHRGRLWLAFKGGSLQPSGVNDPTVFSALQGAAEIGVGQEITALLEEMSPSQSAFYSTSTLFIFCMAETHTITGDGPNWILGPYAKETGAFPFSVQRLGQGVFLCDRGFATLQAIQQLGNFALATISQKIAGIVPNIKSKAVCSTLSKDRSLYRLLLSDGTFISLGFRDLKPIGFGICDLGQAMSCSWAGETTAGQQILLMGGTNGYVYQMDSGINIDGTQINAFMRLPFHFSKTPSRQKRYRRVQFDVQAMGPCTLTFSPDYDFAIPSVQGDVPRTVALSGGGAFWDVGYWDSFNWDAQPYIAPTFKLEGSGKNISILISHQSTNEPSHSLQGASFHKSTRRLDRASLT